jgi:hypothetical protein
VFALGGTFVPVEGGTILDASYEVHLDVWSAVNILALLVLAVLGPIVAAHTAFFPYALAGGACLAGWLTVLGPRVMWRVWRDEVLTFLKEAVAAEPMEGRPSLH